MMRQTRWLGAVLVLGTLGLTGCNQLIGKFIPPIERTGDVMNLKDEKLVAGPLVKPLSVQAGSKITVQFKDIDPGDTRGFAPNKIDAALKLVAIELTGCVPTADKFTVTTNAKVTVSDAKGSTDASGSASFEVSKVDGVYKIVGDPAYAVSFNRALFGIVTTGGDNTAVMEGTVVASDDSLLGCIISVTLGDQNIKFSDFS